MNAGHRFDTHRTACLPSFMLVWMQAEGFLTVVPNFACFPMCCNEQTNSSTTLGEPDPRTVFKGLLILPVVGNDVGALPAASCASVGHFHIPSPVPTATAQHHRQANATAAHVTAARPGTDAAAVQECATAWSFAWTGVGACMCQLADAVLQRHGLQRHHLGKHVAGVFCSAAASIIHHSPGCAQTFS